jgi:hypothetical protein
LKDRAIYLPKTRWPTITPKKIASRPLPTPPTGTSRGPTRRLSQGTGTFQASKNSLADDHSKENRLSTPPHSPHGDLSGTDQATFPGDWDVSPSPDLHGQDSCLNRSRRGESDTKPRSFVVRIERPSYLSSKNSLADDHSKEKRLSTPPHSPHGDLSGPDQATFPGDWDVPPSPDLHGQNFCRTPPAKTQEGRITTPRGTSLPSLPARDLKSMSSRIRCDIIFDRSTRFAK